MLVPLKMSDQKESRSQYLSLHSLCQKEVKYTSISLVFFESGQRRKGDLLSPLKLWLL